MSDIIRKFKYAVRHSSNYTLNDDHHSIYAVMSGDSVTISRTSDNQYGKTLYIYGMENIKSLVKANKPLPDHIKQQLKNK